MFFLRIILRGLYFRDGAPTLPVTKRFIGPFWGAKAIGALKSMKHYDIIQWVDFARDAISPVARAAMRDHLLTGCRDCQLTLSLLEKAVAAAREDAQFEVIPEMAKAAKAIFAIEAPKREPVLQRVFGRLRFDSFAQTMPEGARAGASAGRHVMFHAGDYYVDLRLERETDSAAGTLVGQIFGRTEAKQPVSAVPVLLMAGKKIVTRTTSNEFGEFILDYMPAKNLRLCVPIRPAGRQLEMSLSRLRAEP